MKVIAEPKPNTKGINESLKRVDFNDTFSTTNHFDSLEIIGKKIFDDFPEWIMALLRLRNFLVKFIGLKVKIPDDYNTEYRVGGYVGYFKIYSIHDNELILGANDSHLCFRVSIFNSHEKNYNIKVTTLVEYQNRKGKFYMWVVAPFHRLVVKRMVKQAWVKPNDTSTAN